MKWIDFENKKIGIWGMGREGNAVKNALQKHVKKYQLVEITEENLSDLFTCQIIVKSPGVSLYRPEIEKIRTLGIQLTSGTNIFMSNKSSKTKVIGITGTKGKSTTCSLLAHTLKELGAQVCLGGNIGIPLIEFVDEKPEFIVAEMSSYQCADLKESVEIGAIMSLFSAHIPWHGSLKRYHQDKLNMIRQAQKSVDIKTCPISIKNGYFYFDKALFPTSSLPLLGEHNQKNACVVLYILHLLGFNLVDCEFAFQTFKSLPHRLQIVGSVNHVTYVNDSIATLPEAVEAALDTFQKQKITLIVGGWDGGYNYQHLNEKIKKQKVLAIALPTTGDKITTPYHVSNMEEAVSLAYLKTPTGGVVLMSPGAPSYNLYKNFEERGQDFIDLVSHLPEKNLSFHQKQHKID